MTPEAHAVSITPGTRFAGFEIVSRRFSGAASDIWEAVPATPSSRLPAGVTPARIALKTLQPQFLLDDGARASFAREIDHHADLKHPNVVRFVDGETRGAHAYLAVEYIDGVTLRQLLEASTHGAVPLGVALSAVASICDALDYVHKRRGPRGLLGLVHGDVSPDNVMIDRGGAAKLLDFGQAIATLDASKERRTSAGFPGTSVVSSRRDPLLRRLQYVAPERIQGTHIDRRSDVYAAGAVLFELVTGVPPFEADGMSALVTRISAGETRSPGGWIEPEIGALVSLAMDVDPEARVQTARELAEMIRAVRVPQDQSKEAIARCVHQAIGLGAPVLELEEDLPPTLRPAPGTELDHIVHELVLATSSSDEEDSPTTPEAPDPRAQSAALEFDRGWRALCDGRRWDALAAWETALVLDPQNPTYAVDVRHLREKLLQ